MMACASSNEDIRGRDRKPPLTGIMGKFARELPYFGRDLQLYEPVFHVLQDAPLVLFARPVPELQLDHRAPAGITRSDQSLHPGPHLSIARRTEAVDPRGSIHQVHAVYPFFRSLRSSSTVIRSRQVPKCFTSSAILWRRLKSVTAVTMAWRFVFAPVNRIASSSSLSGISTVVFMIPVYNILESLSMVKGFQTPKTKLG